MKKIISFLVLILGILLPLSVNADVQTFDLVDTLKSENINPLFEDYEENENQITIYLFRGEGCTHCRHFLEFLNTITEEYGEKFKLRSYEVYNNPDNRALKDSVVEFFEMNASGVPLIVIGENTFYGFSASSEDKIISAIESEYESKNRYDVFSEMEKKKDEKNPNDLLFVLIPVIGIVIIAYIVNKAKSTVE